MQEGDSFFPHLVAKLTEEGPRVDQVFGEPRFHTDGEVAALAFAADGSLWSIDESGALIHWDAAGRPLSREPLGDSVALWAFSPDAARLASGTDALALWDVAAAEPLWRHEQPTWVTAMAYAADGQTAATGHDDGVVRLHAVEPYAVNKEFKAHDAAVSAVSFRPDGAKIATAGEDRLIHVWDVATGTCEHTFRGHTDRVPALVWHPTEGYLVSAGWDTTARVWVIGEADPRMLLNSHSEQVLNLAMSRDGRYLACADSDNVLHLWTDPKAGAAGHVLAGHRGEVRALAFSHDGTRLASAGEDAVIHLWDSGTGRLVAGLDTPTGNQVAFLPGADGGKVACVAGGSLYVWGADGSPAASPAVDDVLAVAASPDGKALATSGTGTLIRVWGTEAAAEKQVCEHTRGPIPRLTFSHDGTRLASASATDGLVWVWEMGKPEAILVIPEAADACTLEAVAFHPDGRRLAVGGVDVMQTGGSDGAICVWDMNERDKLMAFEGGVLDLAFDPAGKLLAGAALRRTVLVWDVESGELAYEVGEGPDAVRAVAFHPSGDWLVSAGDDHSLHVWSALDGKLKVSRELDSPVQALAFSPDGEQLYLANANTTCYRLAFRPLVEG